MPIDQIIAVAYKPDTQYEDKDMYLLALALE